MACVAAVAAVDDDLHAQVLRSDSTVNADSYQWKYETSNGIGAEATGELRNLGPEQEAIVSRGQYGWTDKDGQKFDIQYVADENGYQPQGAHLPTPPPIPAQIARALEWLAAHPPAPEH